MATLSYPKSKIKVLLLENIHENAMETFKENGFTNVELIKSALSPEELIGQIQDAHILGIRSGTHVRKEALAKSPKLLALGCFCIGTNQVDLQEAMIRGIPVFNDPHSSTRSVAEMVICLAIALLRGIFPKNAAAHAGKWNKLTAGAHEVRGKTLGIVGYGRIGSQVSILAESLGMHVIYYDIEKKLSIGNSKPVATLEALLSNSDIVSLHVPETPLTKNLINREKLKLFKKTAFLINTSRGNVVEIQALAELLSKKEIKGAAVDVFPREPHDNTIPFVTPLQGLENVIMTPHVGGATEEAQENIAVTVALKLIHFVDRGSTEGSPNFPELTLNPNQNSHRILHIHRNIPGILSQINKILADKNINILAQYLRTNKDIGYVVFDIQKDYRDHLIDALQNIEGTIRARILY